MPSFLNLYNRHRFYVKEAVRLCQPSVGSVTQILKSLSGRLNDWYPAPGQKRIARNKFKGGRFDTHQMPENKELLFNIKSELHHHLYMALNVVVETSTCSW